MSQDRAGADREAATREARALEALTEEILPALIAHLRASRLGELEVRRDGWRVRLRRQLETVGPVGHSGGSNAPVAEAPDNGTSMARSPAVGYFSPGRLMVLGATVQSGDLLGTIDVLGIAQDVIAPDDGIISRILAEDGQAVEYGQVLAQVDRLELVPDEPVEDEQGPA
jgi:acetyl-CoA carboxylase biotin carboxyl carrier protein